MIETMATPPDGSETRAPAAGGPARAAASVRIVPARVRPWLLLLVVLVSAGAIVGAMRRTSATFDEIAFMGTGARGYHLGRFDAIPDHPPLLQYFYGLPIYLAGPRFPADFGSAQHPGYRYAYSKRLLWESGNDPERLVFLSRLVAVAFALSLILGVWAVTRRAAGADAALLAAGLAAFLPDVLAHGGVSYGDVPFTAAYLFTVAAFDAAVRRPSAARGVLAGAAAALAVGIKYSALALAPVAVLLVCAEAATRPKDRDWWRRVGLAAAAGLLTLYVALVAMYGGDPKLAEFRYGLLLTRMHVELGHGVPSYLLGHTSEQGWWYFYPVAFLFKTPAALHALILLAVLGYVRAARGGRGPGAAEAAGAVDATAAQAAPAAPTRLRAALASPLRAVAIAPLVFLAFLLRSHLDIGFRYALPALPFLGILVAVGLARLWATSSRLVRGVVAALLVAYAASSLSFYPHFLAYTSEYAPGRDRGDEVLLDSSLDWGQGLLELRDFMRQEHIDRVYLSYFGSALPAGYGIDYVPLPSFFSLPPARPARPGDREPEWVVVSATTLHGLYLRGDPFARLRSRRPDRVLAHSLFVYRLRNDPGSRARPGR
ncbi:MAG TPA: phospholipid carrier-dependent glycosyltransferase [Longimicrobiales bacterium]|nr:phospholipid carrier-dependent glycosyltransferase [Longimicrobiales bacterium]